MTYLEDCFKAYRISKRRCRPLKEGKHWREPWDWPGKDYIETVFELEPMPKRDVEFETLMSAVRKLPLDGTKSAEQIANSIWTALEIDNPEVIEPLLKEDTYYNAKGME